MKNQKSDHNHRNEQGNPVPCSKPKTECDELHQADYERKEAQEKE